MVLIPMSRPLMRMMMTAWASLTDKKTMRFKRYSSVSPSLPSQRCSCSSQASMAVLRSRSLTLVSKARNAELLTILISLLTTTAPDLEALHSQGQDELKTTSTAPSIKQEWTKSGFHTRTRLNSLGCSIAALKTVTSTRQEYAASRSARKS